MAVVRKWDGIGVTNGTLGSKAGAGDTAFDSSSASPAVSNEAIEKANSTLNRWGWDLTTMGNIAVRFYLVMRNVPGGTSTIFQAWNTNAPSGRVFGLAVNASSQISLRDSANSALYTSPALTLGRLYVVDAWKASGNTTVNLRIRDVVTGSDVASGSGAVGTSNTVGYVEWGQSSGTNSGGWRYSLFRVDDTAARIDTFVPESGDYEVETTTYANSTTTNSHTVDIPATAYGDQLAMIFRAGSTSTATAPGGWTELTSETDAGGTTYLFTRTATGAEGSTVSVPTSSTIRASAIVYRVRGAISVEAADGATADAPSLSPAWGSARNFWLAAVTNRRSDSSLTLSPTGFNGLRTAAPASSSSTDRTRVTVSETYATGSSLNPGTFTTSGTVDSPHSLTIAFQAGDPGEPPAPEDNLEWFTWDGSDLIPLETLGIYEGA